MFTFVMLGKKIFLLGMCLKEGVYVIGYYGLLALWGEMRPTASLSLHHTQLWT